MDVAKLRKDLDSVFDGLNYEMKKLEKQSGSVSKEELFDLQLQNWYVLTALHDSLLKCLEGK